METIQNNNIIKITDNSNKTVSINDLVECVSSEGVITNKEVKEIIKFDEYSYILRYNTKNLACKYILPCLFASSNRINYKTHIINTYLNTDKTKIYVEALYDEELDNVLISNGSFRNIVDKDWSYVYEYSIPSAFNKELDLILQGKYSQISDGYKSMVMSFFGNTLVKFTGNGGSYLADTRHLKSKSKVTHLNRVFDRSPKLRKELEEEFNTTLQPTQELEALFNTNEFREFN